MGRKLKIKHKSQTGIAELVPIKKGVYFLFLVLKMWHVVLSGLHSDMCSFLSRQAAADEMTPAIPVWALGYLVQIAS